MSTSKIRPGQNNRNRRTEPEPNRNTRNQNRTNTLKYPNGSYIFISEITEPNRNRTENRTENRTGSRTYGDIRRDDGDS
ncbi:hypothetical protein YC2023_076148 [Brassica napus]